MSEYTREVWVRVSMLAVWVTLASGAIALVSPDRDLAAFGLVSLALVAALALLRPFRGSHLVLAGVLGLLFAAFQALRSLASGADPEAPYLPAAAIGAFSCALTAIVGDTLRDALMRYDAELAARTQVIEEIEVTDPWTGAVKRTHADRLLNEEVERARRYARTFSLLMLGPDNWGEFARSKGTQQANQAIRALSSEYKSRLRTVDTLVHVGDAVFAALLPETPVAGAQVVAEKLSEAGEIVLNGLEVRAGVATFPDDEVTGPGLIREAEEALRFAETAAIKVASRALLS